MSEEPAQQAGDASGAEMQAPKPTAEEASRTAEDKLMDVVDKILDPGLPFPKYADTVKPAAVARTLSTALHTPARMAGVRLPEFQEPAAQDLHRHR